MQQIHRFADACEHLKVHEYKSKRMIISDQNDKPMRIQIPRMHMPWGCSSFTPDAGDPKYNLDFTLQGFDDEETAVGKFHASLRQIESKIIDEVVAQSEAIFGSKRPRAEIEAMWNSNVKESAGDYDPKFRVKVMGTVDNGVRAECFSGEDKRRLSDKLEPRLYSGNSGKAIVELSSVYFMNKMIGCVWKLSQLLVYEPERLTGFDNFQL